VALAPGLRGGNYKRFMTLNLSPPVNNDVNMFNYNITIAYNNRWKVPEQHTGWRRKLHWCRHGKPTGFWRQPRECVRSKVRPRSAASNQSFEVRLRASFQRSLWDHYDMLWHNMMFWMHWMHGMHWMQCRWSHQVFSFRGETQSRRNRDRILLIFWM